MVEVHLEPTFIWLYSPDYDTSQSASSSHFILSLSGIHYTPSVSGQFLPQKIPPNYLQNVFFPCHPARSGLGKYTSVTYKYLQQQIMKLKVPLNLSKEIIFARTLPLEVGVYLAIQKVVKSQIVRCLHITKAHDIIIYPKYTGSLTGSLGQMCI